MKIGMQMFDPRTALSFDGKAVVVTGASSGIGAAIATAFGAAGANVLVHYGHSHDRAAQVRDAVVDAGGQATIFGYDVQDHGFGEALVEAALTHAGTIDVLVNNAGGLSARTPVTAVDDDFFTSQMRLNFGSVFDATRAVARHMEDRGSGSIINITSMSARNGGNPGAALYATAKAAVSSFTRALAKELAPNGIRVNALSPGVIDTPLHAVTPPDMMAVMRAGIPMGRLGEAWECAGPVLFLASDQLSSFVTGHVLEANGGHLMG